MTTYGRLILDVICDRVATVNCMGFVGWTVGRTEDVVASIASQIGRSRRSVAGALSHLINDGYLSSNSQSDDEYGKEHSDRIGITHKGWEAYSQFDKDQIMSLYGDDAPPQPISYPDWSEWDGVDCTCFPFRSATAFERMQR